jgi:hypothetical protein
MVTTGWIEYRESRFGLLRTGPGKSVTGYPDTGPGHYANLYQHGSEDTSYPPRRDSSVQGDMWKEKPRYAADPVKKDFKSSQNGSLSLA